MKRLFLIIGFLLLPTAVHAEALSPWVQGVLERADAGVSFANGLSETSCNPLTLASEIDNNQTLIRSLIIPAAAREGEAASLRERTVCFQSDKHLLELKIREVQEAMSAAVQACKISTGKGLRETYKFLVGAYDSFLEGGANPAYTNDLLRYRYPFHDSALWNIGAGNPVTETGSTAPICPYTTDYGVHSIAYIPTAVGGGAVVGGPSFDVRSFGCDKDVLGTLVAPYNQEAETLRNFIIETENFSTSLYNTVSLALFNINNVIGVLTGTIAPNTLPGARPSPSHEEKTGCLKPLQPDFSSDSPAQINAILSAYPDYFELHNLRDDGSGNFTYNPSPDETLPTGMLHLPIVDYFLSVPNAGIATRSYIDAREKMGLRRPLPNYLVGQVFDSFLNALTRTADTSTKLLQITSNIEREMGIFEAGNTDALERMQDSSVPLEAAVQALIKIVDDDLPKKYIPQLTFFLARSCVDGHCQRTLDAVAKRTFNPYCHPYVSGKYLEEDAYKRCYCYPEIQSKDADFWKQYCSSDFTEDMGTYDALTPTFIPACIEESLASSRSSP